MKVSKSTMLVGALVFFGCETGAPPTPPLICGGVVCDVGTR